MVGIERTHRLRDVLYRQFPGRSQLAEVLTIAEARRRGGLEEFLGPQRVGFDLLVQVTEGVAHHEVDSRVYTLNPGDLLWVHVGQVQCWEAVAHIEGRLILFRPAIIDPDTAGMIERSGALARNHWPGVARPGSPVDLAMASVTAAEAAAPAQRRHLDDQIVCQAVCLVLLCLAAVQETDGVAPGAETDLFESFRAEVEARYRRSRALADYARVLGVSERTLNRAATRRSGKSASQHISARVVLEAQRLLSYQSLPIAVVAAQLGFDDASNFSKFFSRRTGVTPGEYRKEVRGR